MADEWRPTVGHYCGAGCQCSAHAVADWKCEHHLRCADTACSYNPAIQAWIKGEQPAADVDPAVQAAVDAYAEAWRAIDRGEPSPGLRGAIEAAVAAARPLIARQAAAQALRDAAWQMPEGEWRAYPRTWLRGRADEIEAGRG